MQTWNLLDIETPGGSLSPAVLATEDGARAVLIGLQPGQELGDHQVKERAWLTVVDGTVRVDADGGPIEIGPETLVTFAPNERHSVRADGGGARILLILAPWPGEGHYRGEERSL